MECNNCKADFSLDNENTDLVKLGNGIIVCWECASYYTFCGIKKIQRMRREIVNVEIVREKK